MAAAGEIVAAALAEGGIDATPAQGIAWLNDRYRRLVAGAKWRKLERPIGPTVAGQARYTLADDVVDVLAVRVAESAPYTLISIEELWGLQSGTLRRTGCGAFFAPVYDDDTEVEAVSLYPVPVTAGDSITALCAVVPPTLGVNDVPKIPEDFHLRGLKEGVIADGLSLIDEANADASYHEQQWQDALEALRKRRTSRVGSGPQRIRVSR